MTLEEESIFDAVSARNGLLFAVATLLQVSIYNSQTKKRLATFKSQREDFHYEKMRFSMDSTHLILVFGQESEIEVQVIKIDGETTSGEITFNRDDI